MTQRIAIATGTRADWGILSPLADALRGTEGVQLQIIATNMHLMPQYGNTIDEITAAGHRVDACVPMPVDGDNDVARVQAMGTCMQGFAKAFDTLKPHKVIVLGDRFEMLAVATAAAMMRISLVHIAGGTVSEGAIDNALRNAITQLATLHLTETEDHRRRVIAMGADPAKAITTGAAGVWNMAHRKLMTRSQLSQSLGGFDIDPGRTLLVTYHPATLDTARPARRINALLEALDRFAGNNIIFTYPNNDAGGQAVATHIKAYADANPGRAIAVPSLGMLRYLSALQYVAAVVGNSSSGIVEVPSAHIPTVDIGIRQKGRTAADSVYHCGDSAGEIASTIAYALSPEGRRRARRAVNPYHNPDTISLMTNAILNLATAPDATTDTDARTTGLN